MDFKNIVMVAAECEPFFSTGSYGSVVGSVSNRLAKVGKDDYEVAVILPLYANISHEYRNKLIYVSQMTVTLSWRKQYCGIYKYEKNDVTYYFLDNEYYFKRHNLYGYFDDAERFAFLSKAALDLICYLNIKPDIIHVHEHVTGLVPIYAKYLYQDREEIKNAKYVYTMHSINYQGIYGLDEDIICDVFGLPMTTKSVFDYKGNLNIVKAAMELSDAVTTGSKTFAKEILTPEFSEGLEYQARRIAEQGKLFGINNGIDKNYYNPAKDKALFEKFDRNDFRKRVLNKVELQRMLSLPVNPDIPMIGMIGQLNKTKGLCDVKQILDKLMVENVQLVILGQGDSYYEDYLIHSSSNYRAKMRSIIAYNTDLARKIFAACDIYLAPSINEPCGINQMVASRYGAVPVVREVGSFKDTIKDFSKGGNGFTYKGNHEELLKTIKRAIEDYKNKQLWKEYQSKVMNVDFGWTKSSKEYIKLYDTLIKK